MRSRQLLSAAITAKMAGKLPARIWDPNKVFDISLEERKAVEERNRMRLSLKSEWQKKYTSPHKGGGGYIVSVST